MTDAVPAQPPVDVAAWLRSIRYPALGIVVVITALTIVAILGRSAYNAPLDPRNDAPDGAHALAVLMVNRGVSVSTVGTLSGLRPGSGTTVLVTDPTALSPRAARLLAATRSTVVLVAPPQNIIDAMGVPASIDDQASGVDLPPGCAVSAAVTAGSARIAGDLYAVHGASGEVSQCYSEGSDAALLVTHRPDGAQTIVFGSGSSLSNAHLATSGNAALALGITDNDRVAWVPAGLAVGPVPKSQRGLFNLLPSRLLWAVLQLFIALAVLALWRARRLGAPIVEPLPVVPRAAETVEGRGRLMQAARTRGRAAEELRTAAVARLRTALHLGGDDDPASVVAVVAARIGRPDTEIAALLYGGEPIDDVALVGLAQELTALETTIRREDPSSTGRSTVKAGTS